MTFASWGVGQYSPTNDASGAHQYIGPKNYKFDGSIRGVIFGHGKGQPAGEIVDPANNPNLTAIMQAVGNVYPTLSCSMGGDQWGNATAVARMTEAVSYLQGTFGAKSGKVLLMGESMGNLSSMNWALANPTLVSAICCVIPVADLNDIVANNRGSLAASVNTAYSGAYSNVTNGPTANPTSYGASLSAIPTQLYYATDDTIVIPSTVTALKTLMGSNCTATAIGTGGHTDTTLANVSIATVLAFLAANA